MKLSWDDAGKRLFETGIEQCALFVVEESTYGNGVAWNGVTLITEKPSGAEDTKLFADNIKYLVMKSAEEYGLTLEAYTYPDEFEECDGTAALTPGVKIGQQTRKTFGLAFKTLIGNDLVGTQYGYKLHLVYGAVASPSEKSRQTVNESPEATTFSWEISTTPVNVTGHKATSCLEIDSTKVNPEKLAAFEKILFGSAEEDARLPMPDEVAELFAEG